MISLSTSLLCCSCPRQTSDWAARPLAKEQLQYAALDAFCLLGLARKLPPEILDTQNLKVGPGLQTDQRVGWTARWLLDRLFCKWLLLFWFCNFLFVAVRRVQWFIEVQQQRRTVHLFVAPMSLVV